MQRRGRLNQHEDSIRKWAANGESDEEIAGRLGSTVYSIKKFRSKNYIYRPRKFAQFETPHTDGALEGAGEHGERKGQKPLQRRRPWANSRRMIAYDLETTLIAEGTPEPLYITAFDSRDGMYSKPIYGGLRELGGLIATDMLTPVRNKTRYVAWNGNRFDNPLVARALLEQTVRTDFVMRPYLTKKGDLRGLLVIGTGEESEGCSWEFLDGMAMTGVMTTLEKFVSTFAPDMPKGKIDVTSFDRENPEHIAYAERDSEALYVALSKTNAIAHGLSGMVLQPTIGNLGIKFLKTRIPEGVKIWKPPYSAQEPIKRSAYRGGYCWSVRQYAGPIWKYDLNQAYAAAMREARLPCGYCAYVKEYSPGDCGIYNVTFELDRRTNVPFFYRADGKPAFTDGAYDTAWITDGEYRQLQSEGWSLTVHEGWVWGETFDLSEMVDELERLRGESPGGPSGPQGTMVKALGNNCYGKFQEELEGQEYLLSKTQPEDYGMLTDVGGESSYLWGRPADPKIKDYHQPQLGTFITAHVRMVVRRAAVAMEEHFLYADTDCVAFSAPADHLPISKTTYGKWKEEELGTFAWINGKKTYADENGNVHVKGLHTDKLTPADIKDWQENDTPPEQEQLQRRGFMRLIRGEDMFSLQTRRGTDFGRLESARRDETGRFIPVTAREAREDRQAQEEHEYYARVDREFERDLARGLRRVILDAGGLRRNADELAEEYAAVPRSVIRKDGLPGDVIAEYLAEEHPELGIEGERDLIDALTRA